MKRVKRLRRIILVPIQSNTEVLEETRTAMLILREGWVTSKLGFSGTMKRVKKLCLLRSIGKALGFERSFSRTMKRMKKLS